MASRYFLLNDYASATGDIVTPGYASASPACVVAIWPFANPTTYVRSQPTSSGPGASGSMLVSDAIKVKPVIVLDKDIMSCTVQDSKTSYIGSCNINLIYSGTNYLYETNCGDWMMVWMLNNQEDRITLLKAISQGQKLNDFYSGLKFIGRVSSVRQSVQQSPQGERNSGYVIQGNSFRELDSQIYFDPVISEHVPGWDDFYSRLSQDIQNFIFLKSDGSTIVPVALEFLLDVTLGKGIPAGHFSQTGNTGLDSTVSAVAGGVISQAAPFAYCVPQQIATALNQSAPVVNGSVSYGALLDTVMGVQTFTDYNSISNLSKSGTGGAAFNPILQAQGSGFGQQASSPSNRFRCVNELIGSVVPETPQFSCIPLWSHLMSYINPAINEMYCTLRPDPNGDIQLTLVVRQYPFTSPLLGQGIKQQSSTGTTYTYPVTSFLSMPRWVINPTLVMHHDLGKSDALRYNFVLIYGDLIQNLTQAAQVDARTQNPPKVDMLDIGRNGIRIYPSQKVKAGLNDLNNNLPGVWMQLTSDFAQSMQMTLSGTIQMFGVQAPIAVGDNVEYEGNVFHIEGISHSWNISGGERDFMTSLQVSMGVLGNPNLSVPVNPTFPDANLFIPTYIDGNQIDQPGTTEQDWTPIKLSVLPGLPAENDTANSGGSTFASDQKGVA